jgi:hypothetical protein
MNNLLLVAVAAIGTMGVVGYLSGDLQQLTVTEPIVRHCARHQETTFVCRTSTRILTWQAGETYAKRVVASEFLMNVSSGNELADAMARRMAERIQEGDFGPMDVRPADPRGPGVGSNSVATQ